MKAKELAEVLLKHPDSEGLVSNEKYLDDIMIKYLRKSLRGEDFSTVLLGKESVSLPLCKREDNTEGCFTQEEKELITNTPITIKSFDFNHNLPTPYEYINDESITDLENVYYHIAWVCEYQRQTFQETKDPEYLEELVRLLPNSYKVVKL